MCTSGPRRSEYSTSRFHKRLPLLPPPAACCRCRCTWPRTRVCRSWPPASRPTSTAPTPPAPCLASSPPLPPPPPRPRSRAAVVHGDRAGCGAKATTGQSVWRRQRRAVVPAGRGIRGLGSRAGVKRGVQTGSCGLGCVWRVRGEARRPKSPPERLCGRRRNGGTGWCKYTDRVRACVGAWGQVRLRNAASLAGARAVPPASAAWRAWEAGDTSRARRCGTAVVVA